MSILKDATVYRGGSTASSLSKETETVTASGSRVMHHRGRMNVGVLQVAFNISAAGGGETALLLDIGEQDFPALLEAMLHLAPAALLPRMAAAVSDHMATLPTRAANLRHEGRVEVLNKAQDAYMTMPADNNEIEKLVHKRVSKFVAELGPKPEEASKPALKVVV